MSGHSGFQAIGNGYRPPVVPPQVGGTGEVRNAAPSGGASGAVDEGDRHGRNYMVDVGEDLTVEVKAIDNDQSFPAYRTGLRTYRLEGAAAGIFLSKTHAVRQTRSLFRRDLFSAIYKKDWLQ